jgi:DnaK suppressor protein
MAKATAKKSTPKKTTKKKAPAKKATKKAAKKTTAAKKTAKPKTVNSKTAKAKKTSKPAKTTKAKKVAASAPKKPVAVKKTAVKAATPAKSNGARKPYFSANELESFRSMLETRREEVAQSMKLFSEGVKGQSAQAGGDLGDLAAREVEDTLNMRIQDKNRKLLNEIEHALVKFVDGTYGICEGSEEYIPKERLNLRPWTRYSVEYKEYIDEMKKRQN